VLRVCVCCRGHNRETKWLAAVVPRAPVQRGANQKNRIQRAEKAVRVSVV